jgi:hypothetical protein
MLERNEKFLSQNPHMFSEMGLMTGNEVQETIDAIKNSIGFSLELNETEMKYNYAGTAYHH